MPIIPTLTSVKIAIYVSFRFQRLYLKLTPNISERFFPKYCASTEIQMTSRIIVIIITPHIVGVPRFFAWSSANSIAFPMSHSLLIFLPRPSLVNKRIPYGMINRVIIAVTIRLVSMNIRLDMNNE